MDTLNSQIFDKSFICLLVLSRDHKDPIITPVLHFSENSLGLGEFLFYFSRKYFDCFMGNFTASLGSLLNKINLLDCGIVLINN